MSESVKTAVIYYSSTGNIHRLAEAAVEGAEKAGSEVRLRRIRENAPQAAIASNEAWAAHAAATADIPVAELDDLDWADVVIFGAPTRYGNIPSQLQQFIDTTNPLWLQGKLADKVYTAFTSTQTAHGGQESTLLSLYTTLYHWGGIVVAPGYTDPIQFQTGNPYGTSHIAVSEPSEVTLDGLRYQARRAVEIAGALKAGRAA
ncbi:NAD(P)H:quinone oxidoreductase [Microlunatus elymi]|uniref:NAD(P)H:quinone oxidoreductase n=1 Tax=Microlunatus elymi TaxID=2596828 RepID=A0A516PUP6_9ACTN|nr:NAD(P)H:quinone oxidoreductase [Microlunatus elymi]QDP94918.1 NAD(P)H:quinone oxidoreductase [Microlunatus elymi]